MADTEVVDAVEEVAAPEETSGAGKRQYPPAVIERDENGELIKPQHVAKPDKSKREAEKKAIEDEIKKLQDKSTALRAQIDERKNSRQGAQGQIQAAREELSRIAEERKTILAERNQIFAERDAVKEALNKKTGASKGLRSELKFNSLAEIEAEIRRLENKQNTETLTLNQEKNLLKEIEALKQSKKSVAQLSAHQENIKQDKEKSKDINARLDAKAKELAEVNERYTVAKNHVEELKATQKSPKEETPKLIEERDGVRKEINDLYTRLKQLRTDHKAEDDKYYAHLRAIKAYKNEKYKQEQEARRQAWEERQKAIEAEEALKIPYEEEMALCDMLVNYLETNFGDEAANATASKSTTAAAAVSAEEGFVVLKRDEEDFMVMGGGKKKGNKKKKGPKKEETITHSLDTIESFSLLSLTPPSARSGVTASIEDLKKKKAHFKTLPRPEKKKPVTTATEGDSSAAVPAAATSPKKVGNKKAGKGGKEFKSGEQDFPTLGLGPAVIAPTIGVYAKHPASSAASPAEDDVAVADVEGEEES